jgi:hypothetical protein
MSSQNRAEVKKKKSKKKERSKLSFADDEEEEAVVGDKRARGDDGELTLYSP